jgi:hypothetical protein
VRFNRSVGVVASLVLAAGVALVPASSASAASKWISVGPYSSSGSCKYERADYAKRYQTTYCYELVYGGERGWYFDVLYPVR